MANAQDTEVDQSLTTADLVDNAERSAPAEERTQASAQTSGTAGFSGSETAETPLVPDDEARELRQKWDAIQAGFVDEPRTAVEQADKLVAGAMTRLAETFAQERSSLEAQWDRGSDVSTEDLRQVLRRYRTFFARLLSV